MLNSSEELKEIYKTGSGAIRLRGTWEEGPTSKGSKTIYITSIPYTVNKATLVEQIGEVAASRKLPPLVDVKDVSTDDVRILLELKKDSDEKMVMAYLFKHTLLQTSFVVNLTCLEPTEGNVDVGRPKRMDLHEMLWHFLHFRLDVVTRRLEHELEALKKRVHILEGFEKVFDALDEILKIVRKSEGKADAAEQIIKRFALDADQTDAILELKIYRLARLEILIIRKELEEKRRRARQINTLLKDEQSRWDIVRVELEEIQKKYGDARRSTISSDEGEAEYTAEDFIVEEDNVVIVSRDGWVKRQKEVKDVATTRLREGDAVLAVLPGSTRASVVFFSNFGVAYTARITDIPASTGYGEPIQRFFKLKDGERIVAALSLDPRVAGEITPKKEGAEPPVHAVAVSSDGYSLRFGLEPFVEPSTRAGRRYARAAEKAEFVGVARVDGRRDPDRRDARGARDAVQGRRGQLPLGARPRRHPDQAVVGRGPRARVHRVDRRSRPDDGRDQPRRRADDQHHQVRRHRPRRQGPRAAAARPVHQGGVASAGGAGAAVRMSAGQLPTSKLQLPRQLPSPTGQGRSEAGLDRWRFGVPWELGVGSWELTRPQS